MPNSLETTDQEAEAVATHPRIRLADIEASIKGEWYCTAGTITKLDGYDHYTICLLEMKNGFLVMGTSAPVSKENFNRELGEKFAREDAIRQIWPKMAFARLEKIYEQSKE